MIKKYTIWRIFLSPHLDELEYLVGPALAAPRPEPSARQVLGDHLGHARFLGHHQHLRELLVLGRSLLFVDLITKKM